YPEISLGYAQETTGRKRAVRTVARPCRRQAPPRGPGPPHAHEGHLCTSGALGMRKKDIVAGLVSKYLGTSAQTLGSYSFQPYEPADRPEVMDPEHAAEFLQIEPATVVDLAAGGKRAGRKNST